MLCMVYGLCLCVCGVHHACRGCSLLQSLCFRIQKMLEVYRPDWCETREDWSVFLFSPQNKWVTFTPRCVFFFFFFPFNQTFFCPGHLVMEWLHQKCVDSKCGLFCRQSLNSFSYKHYRLATGRSSKQYQGWVGRLCSPTSSIGRTGCRASSEKDYIRVLIATFQITKGYFLPSPLLLGSQKQASGGKCNTIGNSLNSALTCTDVVLQSAEEGFE